MALNPNFPVIDYAISWPNGPQQSSQQPYWCSLAERSDATYGNGADGTRGKQYELDQVQPAEMHVSFTNKDGALDPANTAGIYAGHVVPYRLFRMRAQWPPTDNLLTQNQATAGEAVQSAGALSFVTMPQIETPWAAGSTPPAWWVWQNPVAPTTVATSATTWQGTKLYNHAVQSSTTYPFNAVGMQGWSVAGGKPHAFTIHARAATGITATAGVTVEWRDASGTVIGIATGLVNTLNTGTLWSTLTFAATAPVNAAGAVVYLTLQTGPAATSWTLQTDGWDVRKGTSTPAYITPGTWYPMFTGYVERWPQRWVASGLYGVSDLTIVDEFAILSQRNLLAPFKADLMALNPNFLYALDESAGTPVFADVTGKRGPMKLNRVATVNTIQAGGSVQSGDNAPPGPDQSIALTGAFLGGSGPVLQTAPPAGPAASGYPVATGSLQVPPDPATGNVGPPASGAFTRLVAVRATGLPAAGASGNCVWMPLDPTGAYGTPDIQINNPVSQQWQFNALAMSPSAPLNSGYFNLPAIANTAGALIDGDWHLLAVSLSSDGRTMQLWADGGTTPVTVTAASSMRSPVGPALAGYTDTIGAVSFANAISNGYWQGNLAFACELPFAMDGTTWAKLATSWRNAWSATGTTSESSDGRYQRILNWLGYVGPTRLSAGMCKSVGPATDIAVDPTSPTAGLQALQNIVDTENGQHFVAADGAIVFQSRADRYNKGAVITFGEKQTAPFNEVPYVVAELDYDPTRIANDVQVAAQYGTAQYRQQDPTSQNRYGAIQLQRTVNSIDPNELAAAAQALLLWNKDPQQRVQTLTVDPSANPAIWPFVLAAELGVGCQVNRRPQGAIVIGIPGFIEQIAWRLDGKTNQMLFDFQVSANANRTFRRFDVARFAPTPGSMTLQSDITASQTSLVILTAAGKAAMTNAGGYPLDIIIDTEQITLTAIPGSTTSPQTFTVTRGTGGTTAAAHSAGAVISLAVPVNYAY